MAATATQANTQDGRSKKRPGPEEQRRIILQAAVHLFRQHGSRSVSISQICTEAGVSRPTFYRCFVDKDALVDAIYQQAVNRPVETMMLRGLQGPGKVEEKVQAALDQLFDTIFDNAPLAELVFIESSDPASPAHAIVDRALTQLAEAMSRDLRWQGSGKPSTVFLKALMAACQWIVHDAIRKGLDEASREEAKSAAWELVRRALYTGH